MCPISARLPCRRRRPNLEKTKSTGNSYLLSSLANGLFWFCCSAWECFFFLNWCLFVCLFVCLLFCFCVIYMFSAASIAEEKSLPFLMITNHIPCSVLFTPESDAPALSVRFPRRMLVCMRSFWRMTEEKTLPRWIWQIKVTFQSHTKITNDLMTVANISPYIFSSRVQRLDERSFQFYR